ncbi:MAG: acyl-CoA-binding protein [Burkholderiales bacterium]|nr:acyl-CoA-binding protein [Burkholderiales bacterium]
MSLQAQFEQAQQDSKNLSERSDNLTLLKIYALFKQATAGDEEGSDDAMQAYIDLINELKG